MDEMQILGAAQPQLLNLSKIRLPWFGCRVSLVRRLTSKALRIREQTPLTSLIRSSPISLVKMSAQTLAILSFWSCFDQISTQNEDFKNLTAIVCFSLGMTTFSNWVGGSVGGRLLEALSNFLAICASYYHYTLTRMVYIEAQLQAGGKTHT